MRRGTGHSVRGTASVLAACALGLLALAMPATAAAQAQESIEIGRLELQDARQILKCFRGYVRASRRPGAEAQLRVCVASAHGRVATVTVAAIRRRVRCLAGAIRRVGLAIAYAEQHGVDEALDEARQSLAVCAIESPMGPLRVDAP